MATPQQASGKPLLFVLNLDKGQNYEGLFDDLYSDLINSLCDKYRVQRARAAEPAKRYLSDPENRPIAILIPDSTLTQRKHKDILEQVVNYIKAGGVAIFAGAFSSFVTQPAMDKLWDAWGLRWKRADYHRTDVALNSDAAQLLRSPLPKSYSQKAVFLSGVDSKHRVYAPTSESMTQSYVFPAEPVDYSQTAVAFAQIGDGWLGYIGDVNNEIGSQDVIHAMLVFAAGR